MTSVRRSLTDFERAEFERLDGIVREHAGAFIAVGEALRRIRDEQLWSEGFDSFESYARARHEIGRSRAEHFISASGTVRQIESVTNCNTLPQRESHVRPLLKLDEPDRPKAWQAAVERANGGKLTARIVREVVREMKGEDEDRPASIGRSLRSMHKQLDSLDLEALSPDELTSLQHLAARIRSYTSQLTVNPTRHEAA